MTKINIKNMTDKQLFVELKKCRKLRNSLEDYHNPAYDDLTWRLHDLSDEFMKRGETKTAGVKQND